MRGGRRREGEEEEEKEEVGGTSWLKACLNFCRQSTNSSSLGGLERSVRTPSGGHRTWQRSVCLTEVSHRSHDSEEGGMIGVPVTHTNLLKQFGNKSINVLLRNAVIQKSEAAWWETAASELISDQHIPHSGFSRICLCGQYCIVVSALLLHILIGVALLPSHLRGFSSCPSCSSSSWRAHRRPRQPSEVWWRKTQCHPGCGSGFAAKRRSCAQDLLMFDSPSRWLAGFLYALFND